jgi:hypothetical protein
LIEGYPQIDHAPFSPDQEMGCRQTTTAPNNRASSYLAPVQADAEALVSMDRFPKKHGLVSS